ncbi:MAG: hypothetical protein QXX84_05665 [Sulfolobales archaeon]
MAQKTIEFKLPNQLVETLNEFMAMGIDINLLLTQFLKMLRDIWISGKEAERKACKEEIEKREKIDKIIKIEELEKKCIETASKNIDSLLESLMIGLISKICLLNSRWAQARSFP